MQARPLGCAGPADTKVPASTLKSRFTAALQKLRDRLRERGVPPELPCAESVLPCSRAVRAISAKAKRWLPLTRQSPLRVLVLASTPIALAANALMAPARFSAATLVASPATNVPAEP